MIEIINKIQAAMELADSPVLYSSLESLRRIAYNKLLEQQAEKRKIVERLKWIGKYDLSDSVRENLETMILELERN